MHKLFSMFAFTIIFIFIFIALVFHSELTLGTVY
jgi:hypothetical protein